MTEKVAQDKQGLYWQSYLLIGIGIFIGILTVSKLKNGTIDWLNVLNVVGFTALFFVSYFLILKGIKRSNGIN